MTDLRSPDVVRTSIVLVMLALVVVLAFVAGTAVGLLVSGTRF